MNNFILGTAQFDSTYSLIGNKNSIKENLKILSLAWEMGIRYLDCAPVYKNAEKTIGRWHLENSKKKFKILTKIQNYNNNELLTKYVHEQIKKSFLNLKVSSFFGFSMHNFDINFNYNLLKYLFENKKKLKLRNIGVTIYSEKDLLNKKDYKEIEIVQLPFNIVNNKILKYIYKEKLKIHGRSIFLKGILINKINFKNNNLTSELHKKLDLCVNKLSRDNKIDLCLNYVRSFKKINNIVIGADNTKHLIEINRAFNNKKLSGDEIKFINNQFKKFDNSIYDPRKWKLNKVG